MAKPAPKFESVKAMYARLWKEADIKPGWRAALEKAALKIIAGRDRYLAVSAKTGVPWFVIGLLHMRESSNSFSKHLHEGSPLTGRTRKIPKGHPKAGNPPFTWEESAYDALVNLKKLNKVAAWTIERICFVCEQYNGWGYYLYHSATLSPYLWQGTDHYGDHDSAAGKYVDDGDWDGREQDQQCGCIAVLKMLMELDPSIRLDEIKPLSERMKEEPALRMQRNGFVALIVASLAYVWDWVVSGLAYVVSLFGIFPDVATTIRNTISSGQEVSTALNIPWPTQVGIAIAVVCIASAIIANFSAQKR